MSKLTEHIILNDLKKRGITDYVIEELTIHKDLGTFPNFNLKVKERELVYITLFNLEAVNGGNAELVFYSAENKATYNKLNTLKQYCDLNDETYQYKSDLVTEFESDIKLIANGGELVDFKSFFIQYYKVTY